MIETNNMFVKTLSEIFAKQTIVLFMKRNMKTRRTIQILNEN